MIIVDYYLDKENEEESGIWANSLVDEPANMEDRLEVFNVEKEYKMEKNIVHAPLIVPDRLMERVSPELGLHYGRFKKDSIEELHIQFMKSGNINRVNAQHDKDNYMDGVYLLEIYQTGDRNQSVLYPDLPEGTLMASYYVENQELKKRIESGEFKGFSIELKKPIRKVQEEIFKSLPTASDDVLLEKEVRGILDTDCLPDNMKEDLIKSVIKEFDERVK